MDFGNKKAINFSLFALIFLLLICSSPSVRSDSYYADLAIDVDSSGFVTIDGVTNYPDLLVQDSQEYTSKKQSYWLLNITKNEIFSEYAYVITLPKSSSINYLKSTGSIRIEEELGNLLVKGYGENKTFSVAIQYQIERNSDGAPLSKESESIIILIFIIFILIMAIVFFYWSKFFKKSDKKVNGVKEYNLKGLSERQRKIMKLLIEQKRPLTQTDIQKELKMPKAAVSRNIRTLERKRLIEKEQIGMSNLITLKKQ